MFNNLKRNFSKIKPHLKEALTPSTMHPTLKLGLYSWGIFIILFWVYFPSPQTTCRLFIARLINENKAVDFLSRSGSLGRGGEYGVQSRCYGILNPSPRRRS
tara:strand:+ start:152 stop:457 length:306 start_codon:yes stop_codon:yes gene_type:complete